MDFRNNPFPLDKHQPVQTSFHVYKFCNFPLNDVLGIHIFKKTTGESLFPLNH